MRLGKRSNGARSRQAPALHSRSEIADIAAVQRLLRPSPKRSFVYREISHDERLAMAVRQCPDRAGSRG